MTNDWTAIGVTLAVLLVLGLFDQTRNTAIGIAVVLAVLMIAKKGIP